MKVHLVRSQEVSKELLNSTYDLLLTHVGPVHFVKWDRTILLTEELLTWERIFGACDEYRTRHKIPAEEFVVLLTSKVNDQNWFSSADPRGTRSIFIHTAGWDNYVVGCAPQHALAFQVHENLLQALMFRSIEEVVQLTHNPAIGCINDMCSWKPDVSLKLRTADICGDCLNLMTERGVTRETIVQALATFDGMRREMLLSRPFQVNEPSDGNLPFPVAYTKRKLSTSNEPLRKFLLLLDHFDSLIRCSVLLVGAVVHGENLVGFFQECEMQERPSLGHWISALQKLTRQPNAATIGLDALPADFFQRLQNVVREANQEHIVELRNEKRGHGYCELHDSGYRTQFEKYSPIVMNIEKILKPLLMRLRCFYVSSVERPHGRILAVRGLNMMGSHPDFVESVIRFEPATFEDIPLIHRVHIVSQDGHKWTDIHPYIRYCECPACHHVRVLVFDGIQYLDPYIGHRVSVETCTAYS